MKISAVTTHVVSRRHDDPAWNPRTVWRQKNALIVTVRTDEGLTGVGESWCTGGSPEPVASVIQHDLKPLVLGSDPTHIGELWHAMYESSAFRGRSGIVMAAISGIDIALWDILGQLAGMPISKLLGMCRETVPTYASGGLYRRGKTVEDLCAEAEQYVQQGFRGVKIKVGGLSVEDDAARVRAVREALGPGPKVMADAVYTWSEPDAVRFCRAVQDCDLYFLEAPLQPENLAGLSRLTTATRIPIAGNEIEATRFGFRDLIGTGAVSFVQPDAVLCGGITEVHRVATYAGIHHLPVTFHSSSSAVALAANLHVAAAIENCDSVEYHMVHQLLFDRVERSTFALDDCATLRAPTGPGLGIGLDPVDL